jgi:hypothetical protein
MVSTKSSCRSRLADPRDPGSRPNHSQTQIGRLTIKASSASNGKSRPSKTAKPKPRSRPAERRICSTAIHPRVVVSTKENGTNQTTSATIKAAGHRRGGSFESAFAASGLCGVPSAVGWRASFGAAPAGPEVASALSVVLSQVIFPRRRAAASTMKATPSNPKNPEKPKTPCHPGMGTGANPRQQRNPRAERFASLSARGDVKVSPKRLATKLPNWGAAAAVGALDDAARPAAFPFPPLVGIERIPVGAAKRFERLLGLGRGLVPCRQYHGPARGGEEGTRAGGRISVMGWGRARR